MAYKSDKSTNYFYVLFLFLFVSLVMLDPTNKLLHLKEYSFVVLIIFTLLFNMGKIYRDGVISYGALLFLALLSLCMGALVFNSDLVGAFSYFKALMFGSVFYALSKLKIKEILIINYWVGLSLSLLISVLLLAYIYGFFNLSNVIGRMIDAETIMVAKRNLFGWDIIMFFYKTMPFCFFALIYSIRQKKIISSLVLLAPIFYGGSRTPMLVALAIILYVLHDRKQKYLRLFLGVMALLSLVYIVAMLTSSDNLQAGDNIKGGVATYLFENSSIFGHGVGAEYFDMERQERTTTTEMTYFEILYQYGWLLSPFVLFIFIRPFFVIYKNAKDVNTKDFAVAYFLYLINAGTNPLLINSTGMYVFACALVIASRVMEYNIIREYRNI